MKMQAWHKGLGAGLAAILMLLGVSAWANAQGLQELAEIRQAIRQKQARWVAGDTSISVLPEHLRQYRARLSKPEVKHTDTFVSAAAPPTGLAATLDWRNNNGLSYVTPIKDQGNCGSCWAFAAAAALESYYLKQENVPGYNENFSEQVLLSCGGAGSCSGGYIDRASNFIRDIGLPPEMDYYYTQTNGRCANAVAGWQQQTYRIGSWSYVCGSTPNVTAIKNALAVYGPLVTTMDVYSDFFSYKSGIYSHTTGPYQGGHAVLIVGYDDVNQCFLVKNSWGTGWGEAGFFRIAFSQSNDLVEFGAYTLAYSPQGTCTYNISPTSQAFASAGGSGSVNVGATAACSWSAASNNNWITISQVTAGNGNGTVYYRVAANRAATTRTGSITVAGQRLIISQAGAIIRRR